ncbi:MAG: multicopper oxidase domain-containing protein [Anaerolineales bacterium]
MTTLSRRNFLKIAGLTGTTLGLAACAQPATQAPIAMANMESSKPTGETAAEMDAMHKQGVETFLANAGKDDKFWSNPLAFTMDGDTKVFEVTCMEGQWPVTPEIQMDAMMYNGIVPGPEIRVTEGDKVRLICKNEMVQSTAVHFHGVRVPNKVDGVPFVTEEPVKTGETRVYEFVAKNPGSHMYHSHHNAAEQVTKGLLAAFIIEPKTPDYKVDGDYVMVINDSGLGLTFNGKSFPFTQPIIAKLGQTIRVRYMNEGLVIHPMHLHGLPQKVIAKDGWPVPQPWLCDTLNVAPGERWDVLIECDEVGVWAFHCHILTHAESAHGMFGMVTVLIVQ